MLPFQPKIEIPHNTITRPIPQSHPIRRRRIRPLHNRLPQPMQLPPRQNNAVDSDVMISGIPPASLAMQPQPAAIASSNAFGMPSHNDGCKNTSHNCKCWLTDTAPPGS